MLNRVLLICLALTGSITGATAAADTNGAAAPKPNVILILADDLGYSDVGCYGQQQIKTPCLDRLAAEGARFTQFYGGTTVCAPSRCALMTGKHTGHTSIRANQRPEIAMSADDATLPEVFKAAGYATALIGKWGLGLSDTPTAPNRKGFDYFYGYPSQTLAHNSFPPSLLRNTNRVFLPKNESGLRATYSHDLFVQEAEAFVRTNQNHPFFLCLSVTIPHANSENHTNGLEVPDDAPYSGEAWPQVEKNFAAMMTRLDTSVGQLTALLKELAIEDRTLVLFTSDNGPHSEGGHNAQFFKSSGELRGAKRALYEGGVRVPLIARWPGRIPAGTVSSQVAALWDFMPTFAALIGQPAPKGMDGISILPALLDNKPVDHPPLFWEFREKAFARAVRMGDWKGVSLDPSLPLELYNLASDVSEKQNVASANTNVVRQIEEIMKREHVPHPTWPDAARKPGP
jgi:arylsulfatase A-like enzyme